LRDSIMTQDMVLGCRPRSADSPFRRWKTPGLHPGDFQPSLRDYSLARVNPGLRPGLLSAVPAGLNFGQASFHADAKAAGLEWCPDRKEGFPAALLGASAAGNNR